MLTHRAEGVEPNLLAWHKRGNCSLCSSIVALEQCGPLQRQYAATRFMAMLQLSLSGDYTRLPSFFAFYGINEPNPSVLRCF